MDWTLANSVWWGKRLKKPVFCTLQWGGLAKNDAFVGRTPCQFEKKRVSARLQ